MDRRLALLVPVCVAVLFAGSFVAAKQAGRALPPLTTTLLRYAVALFFLLAVGLRGGRLAARVALADVPIFAALGLSGIVGYHLFFFWALRYTPLAHTAIINAMNPLLIAAMAALFLRERLEPAHYAGLLLGVGGTLLILTRGRPQLLLAMRVNEGDGLMVLAMLSWTAYALLIKKLQGRYSSYTLTFYATLAGVLVLLLAALPESYLRLAGRISLEGWAAILYMGIAASGVGYWLYNVSIAAVGPTRTAGLVYGLVPLLVALLAWLAFGEPITPLMLLSGGLSIAGLQLLRRRTRGGG